MKEKLTLSKKVMFEAAHRLFRYNGKCSSIHGHHYTAWIKLCNDGLTDDIGMALDFGTIEDIIEPLISVLDHSIMLWKEDIELVNAVKSIDNQRYIILSSNPTAENIAKLFYNYISKKFDEEQYPVKLHSVRIDENIENYITVSYSDPGVDIVEHHSL